MTARCLLLLGASGRLGATVRRTAPPNWRLDVPTRIELDLQRLASGDTGPLEARLAHAPPEVVLNTAAMAGVDACEVQREEATAVNALAPAVLAKVCARAKVPLVHVSTDYVFGGIGSQRTGPYAENAVQCPAQHYGATKAEGERGVLDAGGRAHVVRLSWIYGSAARAFLDHVLGQVDGSGQAVAVFGAQRSRPTPATSVSKWLLALCDLLARGQAAPSILHPVSGPSASRNQWARAILDDQGHDQVPITEAPMQVRGFSKTAVRPVDSRLDGTATMRWAEQVGMPALLDWRDSPSSN
ncbi:MAG TPA: hypothetical protein DIU15_08080 [Deltaproteobacteria bacterium]|nr:hypothetical protein [Deltaproteobacteria bacterium]HCP45982.1 hypothetical protein [Deltaproteobacteria bacterium]